ncbi:hypothetical protein GQ600_21233 [Phytophthora cactorum]|nr:hypothetical protein GQ600_21233 [Phytophthora cactorum]
MSTSVPSLIESPMDGTLTVWMAWRPADAWKARRSGVDSDREQRSIVRYVKKASFGPHVGPPQDF